MKIRVVVRLAWVNFAVVYDIGKPKSAIRPTKGCLRKSIYATTVFFRYLASEIVSP